MERFALGQFVRARLVGRCIRLSIIGMRQAIGEQICLYFFAANIRKHVPVHINARTEHLTAFFDHLLPLDRIVDDVPIFVGKIVFAEHGADTLAPATGRFQVSYNFRFIHKSVALLICHSFGKVPRPIVSSYPRLTLNISLPTLPLLNVLIIPDKFKGTLSAMAAAKAIARGWRGVRPKDKLKLLPMSDGGDGFGELMGKRLGARARLAKTLDAAHRSCTASWWCEAESKTVLIDSSRVIGLAMLPPGRFHPFELDTFGLGILLRRAARRGTKHCLVGIGGSATNDGGFGLARALGWIFCDATGTPIERWTELGSLTHLRPPMQRCLIEDITIAVDVDNPLLGPCGATRVYGPQKGLRSLDFKRAESCLQRLAQVVRRELGHDFARIKGAGAGGGLGFGFLAFSGARLVPGFDLFATQAGVEAHLSAADLVVTGEGALDQSTLMGKGVGKVAKRCRRLGIPCIGLAGIDSDEVATGKAFTRTHALRDLTTIQEAKAQPAYWLERLAAAAAQGFGPRRCPGGP